MSVTKRQEQILELLNENRFLTVEKLSQLTYTSPSSIRRDLTKLQNMYFIKRTHGGASVLNENNQVAPFNNRMSQNDRMDTGGAVLLGFVYDKQRYTRSVI